MNVPNLGHPIPLDRLKQMAQNHASQQAPTPAPASVRLTPPDQLARPLSQASAAPSLDLFSSAPPPLITKDSRVLHIGDSHTVGIYGQTMDKLLRSTGAKVETYGSAGSSPSWWLNETTTRSGFFSKNENEKVNQPHWQTPHKTPKFAELIQKFKPNLIMISLGANLQGANPEAIEKQIRMVGDIAKANGVKVIWVGPPNGRPDKKPQAVQDKLVEAVKKTASEYGDFIDSRPYTHYDAKEGGDGVHFWGKTGTKTATGWANQVFEQIQGN